jgi:hypothetical protein
MSRDGHGERSITGESLKAKKVKLKFTANL